MILHHDVGMPMTRTQLSFEREMLKRAKRRAGELGISLAEYVRRLVEDDLGQRRPSTDASAIFDLGASGGSDIAAQKDAMVGEAMAEGRG